MSSRVAKLGLAAVLAYGLFDGVTYTSFFTLAFLGYEKSTGKNPAANLKALLGVSYPRELAIYYLPAFIILAMHPSSQLAMAITPPDSHCRDDSSSPEPELRTPRSIRPLLQAIHPIHSPLDVR